MGHERLQDQLAEQGVEAAVLLHGPNVAYATGLTPLGVDATHASFRRDVAVVVAGQDRPLLLTDRSPEALAGVDADFAPGSWPETAEGAIALGDRVAALVGGDATVAVDELTAEMVAQGVLRDAVDAGRVVGAAKLVKEADEVAAIAEAQQRTEAAMLPARAALQPGASRREVVAAFLAALAEAGAGANLIDPIFQPVPRRLADGPRTTTGHVAFPVAQRDWVYAEGDLVWVDAGVDCRGHASDFGRTWVVGRDPISAEREQGRRWRDVVDAASAVVRPGATLGDLTRAAAAADPVAGDGSVPWLPHFYLAHGVGVESAEMPLAGTDLGADFDDGFALASGMVLVFEPVIWEDGIGGYRAEEIVAVTDDGARRLGAAPDHEGFG